MNKIENNKNDEIPSFQHEYDFIRSVFIDRFVWNCEYFKNIYAPTYIESNLFEYGMMGLFKDEKYGFMLLPCVGQSQNLDIYGEPVEYKCTGDGYSKIVSKDDIVLLTNNNIGTSPSSQVREYASRITEICNNCANAKNLEVLLLHKQEIRNDIFSRLGLKFAKSDKLAEDILLAHIIARTRFVEAAKKRFNFDISFKSIYDYKEELSARLQ
ncbi:hypothetical protein LBE40_08300 [Bartonella taylorii]|uniref:Uncharacterized protein n=1 Tax=Bartonella taylorii 8TBB TaxID=1094560 RepID=A0A9P2S164_BARTA|nr:hypothetical protein [Bartonella taylorii]EJF97731.1 hypothetical protein ME9_00110 [Bartonella taylorii 8TBB]USP01258.1 hypothetical protein LBE40_08300 [Bartonella taylorii]